LFSYQQFILHNHFVFYKNLKKLMIIMVCW